MIKEIIKKVTSQIPENLTGVDRQMLIGEKVNQYSREERASLRKTIEQALTKMSGNDSSDIDLGGFGCKGYIWYRIHGTKKPDESFEKFTLAETDVLCQNLLAQTQMEHLYKNRNLDY